MNEQKLQDIVSHLDYILSEINFLKSKLTTEDGLHLNIINEPELFAIELWDSELLQPRMLSYFPRNTEVDIQKECHKALDIILTPRAARKTIFWNSEVSWEKLGEHYQKLDQVFKFEKRELSNDLREVVKGRIHALYTMSE